MSFNIRYGTAQDGQDRWENRRDLLIQTIQAFHPDILGTQEVLAFQADELRKTLKEYGFTGVGRNDGKRSGEFVPIHHRLDKFELLQEGHFWLSLTPEVPGSRGWDASDTRMVSWVKLKSRGEGGGVLHVFNTHFDHRGPQARSESARLLRQRIEALGPQAPVLLMGDFNCPDLSEPHQALVRGPEGAALQLEDSYRSVHPKPGPEEATFHGFNGGTTGRRIDWILSSPHFKPLEAAIDHTSRMGRYPSDHYPVTALLRRVP